MTKKLALDYLLSIPWAIQPQMLELMAQIAEREHEYAGNLQALEAKLGRRLENTRSTTMRDGIAIIAADGPLFKRASFFDAISGATDYAALATDLTAALDDPAVRGVMLSIDSPGGQVDALADLVALVRGASKPVWAHTDGTMASAAYWLGSAAGKVFASETAIIGSIGVVSGIKVKEPKAGEKTYKFVSSQSPMKHLDPDSEAGAASIQTMVDDLAQVFIDSVAAHRGVSADVVASSFGRGDTMIASKAKAAGIIDGVASFEAAFSEFKKELSSMDYSKLTATALAENRPDLVTAIADKASAQALAGVQTVDAEAIRAAAVTEERTRLAAIDALAMPGAEAVIAACKADGTSADATAVKVLQAIKAAGANKGAAALATIKGAEENMQKPSANGGDDERTEAQKDDDDMKALRAHGVIR